MDDIYDDLDNYEDLNILEELKKENHDLKLKLEEYTVAMSKLQKDFDKLSSDFKNLEKNYSSLLKTAKVEIERKTKIITDLNIEKDMIVINALQNRNIKDIRQLKSVTKPLTTVSTKNYSSNKARSNVPAAENAKGTTNTVGRKEDIRFSSVETTTTSGITDISRKLTQIANTSSEKVELWNERTKDSKENISSSHKNVENINTPNQALSIKNRRKSMPAVRSNSKYSSDEECEDRYCANDNYKNSYREDPKQQNIDKLYSDPHRYKRFDERHKPSEKPYVDDRYYGYSEKNRDPYYRSRNERYYSSDKHRSRNKYESSQRHRRNLSPERLRRAPNEDRQKQEYGRYRVLESPTREKHYQDRIQETRFKRDRDDAYELENRDHNFDKYSLKHNNDHYEHISKKQRTDSLSKFSEEETRWSRDRTLEKPVPDLYENVQQDLSCQSPDYISTDAGPSHPVREIMNTALTPLEDPRIHSKRYIVKTSDDNVALTTVTGRNIDLKLLDATQWNNPPVEVPKSLTRRPSQCSEDIVKEIYMDIDNPLSNMSAESGEILSFDIEYNLNDVNNVPNESKLHRSQQSEESDSSKKPTISEAKSIPTKYKIPKIKTNSLEHKVNTKRNEYPRSSDVPKSQNKNEKPIEDLEKVKDNKIIPECDFKNKNTSVNKEQLTTAISEDNKNSSLCAIIFDDSYKKSMSSMKELVEGDLELSDETCDNIEFKNYPAESKKSVSKDKPNTDLISEKPNESFQNIVSDQKEISIDKNSIDKEAGHDNSSDTVPEDHKKRSNKKRASKSKEPPKVVKKDILDKENDKKSKSKKDTKDPKEIKTKFSELFGDSSSLITPEDLGIQAAHGLIQQSAAYIPICEDAQDAVDVTASNVKKVPTRLSEQKSLEIVHPHEVSETNATKTEIKTDSKTKIHSEDTKKKTRLNAAEVVKNDKSKIREAYQSLIADKLVVDKNASSQNSTADELSVKAIATGTTAEEPVEKKQDATAKEPCETVVEINKAPEKQPMPVVDKKCEITKPSENDMPYKQNVLIRALATSTPHKEHQQDTGTFAVAQSSNCPVSSSKATSSENVIVEQSSNNDTMDSQNDADVPDVRIFVRRKRKIKTPKQSAT